MEYLVTAQEMKRLDRETTERIGIPSMVLMERAALAVAEEAWKRTAAERKSKTATALVLAGCGNNGADGLAAARLLCERGCRVEVVVAGNPEHATEEWRRQMSILENYPVRTDSKYDGKEYTILIDALFGVGLSRDVTGEYAGHIERFNGLSGFKVSVDVPSGIGSDDGRRMGCCVKADLTVTFAFAKRGLFTGSGREAAGEVAVCDIGIGENAFGGVPPRMFRCTETPAELLPLRPRDGNKGTFGKVLLAAGSRNMAGAAVLAARAAYRAGAGMVKVITPECNRVIVQSCVPEALLGEPADFERGLEWADVLAVGPGLGTGGGAAGLLSAAAEKSSLPLLIDADGLNILAADKSLQELLAAQGAAGRPVLVTPHVGELSRLTGLTVQELKTRLPEFGEELAARTNWVVVAKDAVTYICREGKPVCMNTTGCSGMATAGSGDVLTGVIAGLLAQGMEAFRASCAGVCLHGLAGSLAAGRFGRHGMTAGDIVQAFGELQQ